MKYINEGFNHRLRQAFDNSGMTYKELADKSGLHLSGLYQYLVHNNMPSTYSLMQLCKALNVSADYLLGLEE